MALCRELRPIVAGQSRVTRGSPVIGFVKTLDKPSVRPSAPLEEKALHWLASISDRKLSSVEDLLCENATYHDDGMWLLQPAQGRTAIRKVWRDWLRSVPDYHMDVIDVASDAATNDAFVMWRASGMAKLSLIPQRPTTNKPFQHYGVTRLHFDPASGRITDQWTWRGPTTDEAHWLLTRSYKPFDFHSFTATAAAGQQHSPSASPSGSPTASFASFLGSLDSLDSIGSNSNNGFAFNDAERARAKGSATLFREVFGAVPDAHVAHLESALSDDYACVEATGVWRALHLRSKEQCEQYCTQRQQQLAGAPHWHSEAITADGRMLFVHFQNVLTHKQHKTLIGLSSGILVHMFDDDQRIQRTMMFRGPMNLSERAEFFNMDCRACGRGQAEQLGVNDKVMSGL